MSGCERLFLALGLVGSCALMPARGAPGPARAGDATGASRRLTGVEVDVSSLPEGGRLVAGLLAERIAVRAPAGLTGATLKVRYALDPSVPGEEARVDVSDGTATVTAGRLRGLVAGTGVLLKALRWTEAGFVVADGRRTFRPAKSLRMAYLARHFLNYFMEAPAEEVLDCIDDLALDGNNSFKFQHDMPAVDAARASVEETAAFLAASRKMRARIAALDCGFCTGGGGDQMREDAPEEFRGEPVAGRTNLGFNACPSKPKAMAAILENQRENLRRLDDGPADYFTYWPYDEGGCGCAACSPWGGNGYMKMNERLDALNRAAHPGSKSIVSAWLFDEADYASFYRYLESHDWIDYVLCDAHEDFPEYPLAHPLPGRARLVTFPEISMWGRYPWGGYGAIMTPRRFERLFRQVEKVADGYMYYSEGIFEDVNKAVVTGLYVSPQTPVEDTLRQYAAYHFAGADPEDFVALARLLEDNHDFEKATRERAVAAQEIARRMDAAMLPRLRTAWRWRLVLLRTLLDVALVGEEDRQPESCRPYFDEVVSIYHAERQRQAMWDGLSNGWTCPRYRPAGERPDPHRDTVLARRRAIYGNFAHVYVSPDPSLAERVPAKGADVPGFAGDTLTLVGTRGAVVKATLVLWSRNPYRDVVAELSAGFPARLSLSESGFGLTPGLNKPLVAAWAVSADAKGGEHAGQVVFRSRGSVIATVPVVLEVRADGDIRARPEGDSASGDFGSRR